MFGLILQFSCLPFLLTMLVLDRDSDFVNEVFERELIMSKRLQVNEPLLSVSGEEEESEQVNKHDEFEEEPIHFLKDEIKQYHICYWMNVVNAAMFISIVSGY